MYIHARPKTTRFLPFPSLVAAPLKEHTNSYQLTLNILSK